MGRWVPSGTCLPLVERHDMAKDNSESWYTKWLRNGRLSGLTFLTLLVVWVSFTIFKLPTEGIQPLLLLAGGAFVGNLALKKEQEEKEVKSRVQELEKKVDHDESTH